MAKFEVLGGDFDKGDGWIYHDGSIVFRKDGMIQRTISHRHVREFDEATDASLSRLGLSRLQPDLQETQLRNPATLGPDIVLYFDEHEAVLIRADETVRQIMRRGLTAATRLILRKKRWTIFQESSRNRTFHSRHYAIPVGMHAPR